MNAGRVAPVILMSRVLAKGDYSDRGYPRGQTFSHVGKLLYPSKSMLSVGVLPIMNTGVRICRSRPIDTLFTKVI